MRSTRAAFKRTAESTSTACDAETIDPTLFPLGCLVHVTGLVVASHHNGKVATVCGNQAGRFHVLLDDGVQLAVKPINLRLAASAAFDVLSFTDCLTGRRVSLALFADGKLQSRDHLHAQILHPLELMQAAAWFVDRQLPGMKRVREDPCVPFGYMLTECSPCVQVRVMFDFVATACRRLATAPAKIRVLYKTTVRWEGRIMELVKRGRVRKVQVWLQRFARLCVVTILLILGCHCLLTL